jgi:hypothetical protein
VAFLGVGVFSDAVEFLGCFALMLSFFRAGAVLIFSGLFLLFGEFCQFLPFYFCVFWVFFVAGLLFGSFVLCRLFFIF